VCRHGDQRRRTTTDVGVNPGGHADRVDDDLRRRRYDVFPSPRQSVHVAVRVIDGIPVRVHAGGPPGLGVTTTMDSSASSARAHPAATGKISSDPEDPSTHAVIAPCDRGSGQLARRRPVRARRYGGRSTCGPKVTIGT
jgi:hypothetical protein